MHSLQLSYKAFTKTFFQIFSTPRSGSQAEELVKAVEWIGVKNQVETLLSSGALARIHTNPTSLTALTALTLETSKIQPTLKHFEPPEILGATCQAAVFLLLDFGSTQHVTAVERVGARSAALQ